MTTASINTNIYIVIQKKIAIQILILFCVLDHRRLNNNTICRSETHSAIQTRGVADSFSGGSPDLKKKTKKTEKTEKIRFFAKYSKQKTMFFSFCIFKDTHFDLKNLKNLKKTEKSEKNLKNILKNFSWFT